MPVPPLGTWAHRWRQALPKRAQAGEAESSLSHTSVCSLGCCVHKYVCVCAETLLGIKVLALSNRFTPSFSFDSHIVVTEKENEA